MKPLLLKGMVVDLVYGHAHEIDTSALLGSLATDGMGYYEFLTTGDCEYLTIRLTEVSEYSPVGATSVSGSFVAPEMIEIPLISPRNLTDLTGNKFWVSQSIAESDREMTCPEGCSCQPMRIIEKEGYEICSDNPCEIDPEAGDPFCAKRGGFIEEIPGETLPEYA